MGRHQGIPFQIQQVAPGQHVIALGPHVLSNLGFNMLVEVATASAFVSNVASPVTRQSVTVVAHLDTGASRTTISDAIAQHLGLVQTGVAPMQTANGKALNPTYAVDLTFVGTSLTGRTDIAVSSCTLPFTMATHAVNPTDAQNFGVLVGRDVMAAWHLTWDGPTSTVIISD